MVARREIILSLTAARLKPGAKILDIGCGTGSFLDAARGQFEVYGLDISPHAVAYCRERGLNTVYEGSAQDLTSVSGLSFDGILLLDVIEHLEDDFSALRKAREVLAENGRVLITVPAFMYFWSQHDEINEHKRRYTATQLRNLLRDTGFEVEKLSYFNSYLFPVAVAVRTCQKLIGVKASEWLFGMKESEYNYRPGMVNSLLRRIFTAEKRFLRNRDFPLGVSILAVARKKAGAATSV